LLWQLRPSDVEVELLAHTRNVVSRDLEQETGLHTGWIQNGGLFIASNKQRLDEYKRLMSLGKVYGVESYVLSPGETKSLYPLMNVDDLYGTLYVPKDGTMDPAGTCSSLARAATARGALIIENCPVTGVEVRTDDLGVRRVAAVATSHGTIQTPCVVNCAGAVVGHSVPAALPQSPPGKPPIGPALAGEAPLSGPRARPAICLLRLVSSGRLPLPTELPRGVWARALGKMAGVNVPLVAMHHAYVVTERIEGIQQECEISPNN
ncbi:UNVERIFIED_CONTAM: hypothetical protein K2H54_049864, partial [Gekko kuhli]